MPVNPNNLNPTEEEQERVKEALAVAQAQRTEARIQAILARRNPTTGEVALTADELQWLLDSGNLSRVIEFDTADT